MKIMRQLVAFRCCTELENLIMGWGIGNERINRRQCKLDAELEFKPDNVGYHSIMATWHLETIAR